MAAGKKIVNVYIEWGDLFEKLTDDEAGRLIKHFFRYVSDQNPEAPDRLTDIAFEPIKKQLQRDLKKWESICERNHENGKKGGRPPKNPNNPVGLNGFMEKPKKADEEEDEDEEDERYKSSSDFPKSHTPKKSIQEREADFKRSVAQKAAAFYPEKMINDFVNYWTEKNEGGKKMRFEMQKVFDVSRRLNTWAIKQQNNSYQNGQTKQQLADADGADRKATILRMAAEACQ